MVVFIGSLKNTRKAEKTAPQVCLYGLFLGCLGCFLVLVLSALYGAVNGFKIDICILGNKKPPKMGGDPLFLGVAAEQKNGGIIPRFGFIRFLQMAINQHRYYLMGLTRAL